MDECMEESHRRTVGLAMQKDKERRLRLREEVENLITMVAPGTE